MWYDRVAILFLAGKVVAKISSYLLSGGKSPRILVETWYKGEWEGGVGGWMDGWMKAGWSCQSHLSPVSPHPSSPCWQQSSKQNTACLPGNSYSLPAQPPPPPAQEDRHAGKDRWENRKAGKDVTESEDIEKWAVWKKQTYNSKYVG